jgi:hypothetical protein
LVRGLPLGFAATSGLDFFGGILGWWLDRQKQQTQITSLSFTTARSKAAQLDPRRITLRKKPEKTRVTRVSLLRKKIIKKPKTTHLILPKSDNAKSRVFSGLLGLKPKKRCAAPEFEYPEIANPS